MLDVASPIATAAALLAVAIALRPVAPPPRWIGGIVKPGSIERTSDGARFTLIEGWGEGPRPVVVELAGELPPTVCDHPGVRADVAIEGRLDNGRFVAERVEGFRNGRYDPCWEWRCIPWEERPRTCRPRDFE